MGAPVQTVIIRSYSPKAKEDAVRQFVVNLLQERVQMMAVFSYEPWDEMVFQDIVATIRFRDKTEGWLEASAGHVCITDHSKSAFWFRGPARR